VRSIFAVGDDVVLPRLQGRNVILADEMGLGKTAQIASLLEALATGDTNPLHDVGKLCVQSVSPFLVLPQLCLRQLVFVWFAVVDGPARPFVALSSSLRRCRR
jgi:hypothetical protein